VAPRRRTQIRQNGAAQVLISIWPAHVQNGGDARGGGKGASVTQRDYWGSRRRAGSPAQCDRGRPWSHALVIVSWVNCHCGPAPATAGSAGRRPIRWWAAGLRAAGRAGTGPGTWKRPASP